MDVPEPRPGPEDLLVRVHATALNRADMLQRAGNYPQPGPKPQHDIPGMEYSGEVIALGDRVEGFSVGDCVMGLLAGGGYAEQVVTHFRLAMKVPANLSWEEAGATPEVYITAHDALLQCGLVAGESVLVHAAGSGVGVAAIQIAKAMGASLVIGTAGSAEKLAQAQALGLDVGVNYREQDFADEVLKATGGRGVDVILDVIGAEYWDRNMRSLALKGRMILVGSWAAIRRTPTSACCSKSAPQSEAQPFARDQSKRRAPPPGPSKRVCCHTSPLDESRSSSTASFHSQKQPPPRSTWAPTRTLAKSSCESNKPEPRASAIGHPTLQAAGRRGQPSL
jgi:NADPH:quinone reductase-like Zn-dependent oxidoreductase